MDYYDSLHLTMFSGKGGVGKTTLACGFARQWAQRSPSDSILLLSTDPAHSLGDVLQIAVGDVPHALKDLPNLHVRALDTQALLGQFKANYGQVLELLVERGSFVQREDLTPIWDLSWPGLDELMGILEIQRLLREQVVDRVVVDMAPSGHTLNLFGLMNFLDEFLIALDLFQAKHRSISQTFTGRYIPDSADEFIQQMQADLAAGRQMLQDADHTACLVVAIAEPMSLLETQRFLVALEDLKIPCGGLFLNRLVAAPAPEAIFKMQDRYSEQQELLNQFLQLAAQRPIFAVPHHLEEPVGILNLDALMAQIQPMPTITLAPAPRVEWATRILPSFNDFVAEQRQLILVGGKGGVGKTTVAAAIAWGLAQKHPDKKIRVISIDPAHSLGDAFGRSLGHAVTQLTPNLSGQEIDAEIVLQQFRQDYLWELAEMMSGQSSDGDSNLTIAYGPEAWRRIVDQALPGIDEMLSLIAVLDLLDQRAQDLIILDMAPTGHLLRFLEMPTALGDWLAWIFKLWLKYQNVLGQTDLMGRLRGLRQRVMQAQKQLKNPAFTEFILVVQAQSAIVAEGQRLTQSLQRMGIAERYVVHNRFEPSQSIKEDFPQQTVVHLPILPRSVTPQERIQGAANLLF